MSFADQMVHLHFFSNQMIFYDKHNVASSALIFFSKKNIAVPYDSPHKSYFLEFEILTLKNEKD